MLCGCQRIPIRFPQAWAFWVYIVYHVESDSAFQEKYSYNHRPKDAVPFYGCLYGDWRYFATSSSAPRVLSLIPSAIRYSFGARSRWPVVSKILPILT
jgi:hypothetical protein